MMAGFTHENIIKLIGFVEDLAKGCAWIVLAWEPNGNVSEFLATGTWEIPERISLVSRHFVSGETCGKSITSFTPDPGYL